MEVEIILRFSNHGQLTPFYTNLSTCWESLAFSVLNLGVTHRHPPGSCSSSGQALQCASFFHQEHHPRQEGARRVIPPAGLPHLSGAILSGGWETLGRFRFHSALRLRGLQ